MTIKKIKRSLLINPPTGLYIREDRCQSCIDDLPTIEMRPPMDLAGMAASLENENVVCKIIDCPMEKVGWEQLSEEIKKNHPDMLVISTTTSTIDEDLQACNIAKKIDKNIVTVAKGAIFFQEDGNIINSFDNLDVAVRGEAGEVVQEIAKGFNLSEIKGITYRENGRTSRNTERPFTEDIDLEPLPARHLIKNEIYTRMDNGRPQATIETGRGCYGQCIYCLTRQVSGYKLRQRSSDNVIAEIKECISKYKIKDFHFRSDTFTANKYWVIELCRKITDEKLKINWVCTSRVDSIDEEMLRLMKKAGCWGISFGLESGSQKMLDLMKKGIKIDQIKNTFRLCNKYSIDSFAYFLIGLPWETEETVDASIKLAIEINPSIAEFFIVYPFPGTEFYEIAVREGLIKEHAFKREGAYGLPSIDTLYLKKERLLDLRKKALRKFYLRPRYMLKLICRIRSGREVFNYFLKGGKALAYFLK
jgi:anaerobic magnesium-protoporphyrin IX monomethyl ester cyclase